PSVDKIENDERPRRRQQDEDDEEDDDRPRPRTRRRREYLEPHRGVLVLIFGILSWLFCVIFGILAWVWGSEDLRKMDDGRMDPAGRGLTQAGRILGIVHCVLSVFGILLACVILGLGGLKGR